MDFSNFSIEELVSFKSQIEELIISKQTKTHEYVTLDYSQYKGTGKAWIAEVDPTTKKILTFLDCENNEKSGYKGTKHYNVPLTEGVVYKFNEEGSKSSDSTYYRKVEGGKLVNL